MLEVQKLLKKNFFFNYTNLGVQGKSQHVTDIGKLTNVVSIANYRKMTQVYSLAV